MFVDSGDPHEGDDALLSNGLGGDDGGWGGIGLAVGDAGWGGDGPGCSGNLTPPVVRVYTSQQLVTRLRGR